MSMRAWAAGVFAVGAIGYAGTHGDAKAAPSDSTDTSAIGRSLGEIAEGHPQQTPGMSDVEWCMKDARYWERAGVEVPDDSECQGKPMSFWRGQQQKRWKS
jgi:hypothetical protein